VQWYTAKQCVARLSEQWSKQQLERVVAAQGGEVARALYAFVMVAKLHEWETQLAQVVQTPAGGWWLPTTW
jgi:hypothetical protein